MRLFDLFPTTVKSTTLFQVSFAGSFMPFLGKCISVVLRGKTRKKMVYFENMMQLSGFLWQSLFWLFQNALMTFEEEKMAKSLTTLRAMEKRCSSNLSWSPSFSSFQSMKSRIWGVGSQSQSTPTTVSKWGLKEFGFFLELTPLASL